VSHNSSLCPISFSLSLSRDKLKVYRTLSTKLTLFHRHRLITSRSESKLTSRDMHGSSLKFPCHFDNLFGPRTNPVVFRKVYPAHSACRVHQKLGRPGNVLPADSCARVNQIIATDHFRLWIRKKREGVPRLLHKIARDRGSVYADRHRTNPNFLQLIQTALNAPQLGVA
jgi:hypothetical protein